MGRIRVSNKELPGFTSEREIILGSEEAREVIYDAAGQYVGTVLYLRRRHAAGGSSYGWVPERNHRAKLTSKVDAIRRLDRVVTS